MKNSKSKITNNPPTKLIVAKTLLTLLINGNIAMSNIPNEKTISNSILNMNGAQNSMIFSSPNNLIISNYIV